MRSVPNILSSFPCAAGDNGWVCRLHKVRSSSHSHAGVVVLVSLSLSLSESCRRVSHAAIYSQCHLCVPAPPQTPAPHAPSRHVNDGSGAGWIRRRKGRLEIVWIYSCTSCEHAPCRLAVAQRRPSLSSSFGREWRAVVGPASRYRVLSSLSNVLLCFLVDIVHVEWIVKLT